MDLNVLWFILIAVLFSGFFFLEGFDYGVGILLPFLGKDEADRRAIVHSVAPFWDGNEVWLLTAGGAMFAAFPHWYATMFSGYYLALTLMLLALIGRGVAFEFRGKKDDPRWRRTWDRMIFLGSAIPALLFGVALANLILGLPIDANKAYTGSFFTLLRPFTLLAGLAAVALATLHGAAFLALRTKDDLRERAHAAANRMWLPSVVLLLLALAAGYLTTDVSQRLGLATTLPPLLGGATLLVAGWFLQRRREGWAFAMTGLTCILAVATLFAGVFPRVMVSNLRPEWSLTIYNASSSPYTLTVMSIVAAIFVPVVLAYQGWTYWIFRERVTRQA